MEQLPMGGYEDYTDREYFVNYTNISAEEALMISDILTSGGHRYFNSVEISVDVDPDILSVKVIPNERLIEHPIDTLDRLVQAVRRTVGQRETNEAA